MDELESLRKVRRLLAEAKRKHPAALDTLSQIDEVLEKLELRISQSRVPARPRKGEGTSYAVTRETGRTYLAEIRPTARPLKAAKELYDIVITILAAADRPLPFDELAVQVNAKSDGNPADWQIRMILRFLQRLQPPILERERNRYRCLNAKQARKHAEEWWRANQIEQ